MSPQGCLGSWEQPHAYCILVIVEPLLHIGSFDGDLDCQLLQAFRKLPSPPWKFEVLSLSFLEKLDHRMYLAPTTAKRTRRRASY